MYAAKLIDTRRQALPPITDADSACSFNCPLVREDLPNNRGVDNYIDWQSATAKEVAQSNYTVSLKIQALQAFSVPMETRTGVAEYKVKIREYNSGRGGWWRCETLGRVCNNFGCSH